MDFPEAMKHLSMGKKVRVKKWAAGEFISRETFLFMPFGMACEDDWEVIEEESPYEESPYEEIIADILADALTEIMELSIFKSSK